MRKVFSFHNPTPLRRGEDKEESPPSLSPLVRGVQSLNPDGESIYDGDTQMVHNLDNALSFDEVRRETASLPTDPVDGAFAHPNAHHAQGRVDG